MVDISMSCVVFARLLTVAEARTYKLNGRIFKVQWFSESKPPSQTQEISKINNVKRIYLHWRNYFQLKLNALRLEWERTMFFTEGGRHAEKHGIRPQQEYTIPKIYFFFVLVIVMLATVPQLYKWPETNKYLKELQEEKENNAKKSRT